MIVLLALVAWILALSLVAGLCAAARAGDRAQPTSAVAGRVIAEADVWESFEHVQISARANVRPLRSAQSGASPVHGDGIAA